MNTSFPTLSFENINDEPVFLAIPRTFPCVSTLSLYEGTISKPFLATIQSLEGIPFLLPEPGNGFYRCVQLLMKQAEINPIKIVSYKNMNTAYQLTAAGIGAIFITPTLFDESSLFVRKN